MMPEYQWIEKMKNIATRNIFGFVSFRSGLNVIIETSNNVSSQTDADATLVVDLQDELVFSPPITTPLINPCKA